MPPAEPVAHAREQAGDAGSRPGRTRPRLLTSAGRHELAGRALRHPVRTIVVVYLVSRVVSLVAMWVAATWFQNPAGVGHTDPGLTDMFGLWDGVWYERIVRDGYPVPLPVDADTGEVTYSAWAFYPLYPYLVKGLMLTGLPFTAAGLLLNLVLGGVAAVLVWAVLRDRRPRRAAAAARPAGARRRDAVVLLPDDRGHAQAVHGGAGGHPRRRGAARPGAAPLPDRGARRAPARLHPRRRPGPGRRRPHPPRAPLAGGPGGGTAAAGHPADGRRWSCSGPSRSARWRGRSWRAWPRGCPPPSSTCRPSGGSGRTRGRSCSGSSGPGRARAWQGWSCSSRSSAPTSRSSSDATAGGSASRRGRGRWPTRCTSSPSSGRSPRCGASSSSTCRWPRCVASVAMRTANGQSVVPHWRRRVFVVLLVLVGGMFWWTCTLLTVHAVGLVPAVTDAGGSGRPEVRVRISWCPPATG